MNRRVLLGLVTLGACGAPTSFPPGPSASPGCPRFVAGVFTDTPCLSSQACLSLVTGTVCARRCYQGDECSAPLCCLPAAGLPHGYCLEPPGGDRSVCAGSPSPPSAFIGTYAGSFASTRTSDRPPSEGVVEQEPAYNIAVSRDLLFAIDPNCALTGTASTSAAISFTAGQRCAPQELLRGATLTLQSGEATLAGGSLTVRLAFRYALAGGTDTGSYDWEFTGTRR